MIAAKDILDSHDCRRICGRVTRATLLRWRAHKQHPFPAPIRRTGSGVELFDRREVKAWLAEWNATYYRDTSGY